ncbi:Dipeptidyl peptidase 4 [Mucor velutinosus]|uniref:Dipeptidyl peptidase 4 n=1 Tax=Mucor velutinosus TaxID=708070 RepID=A0AAN7HYT3_9FUNG|nr:Dipeptidyl peptidase 4 [Mucor velutinosus]
MVGQNHHIQSISYSKLAEYDQTRIDLPIRKYVLIANLLREPSSPSTESEQHWFDTCLDELDKEEERQRQLEQEQAQEEEQEQLNKRKFQRRKPDLHVHTFYNYRNRSGFLVCTSNM